MNYGYQGPPVNNFGRPSAPTSFGPPYPTNDSTYPPSNSPYPPNSQPYPPSYPTYPSSDQSYPPSNPCYPPRHQSYPPNDPCYPPINPSYPQSQNIGFPKASMSSNMVYPNIPHPNDLNEHAGCPNPPQQGSYPPHQAFYPPQQGSYPPQQASFPPQQTHHTYSQQFSVAPNHGGNISKGSWSGEKVPSKFQQPTTPVKLSPTVHPCSGFDPRKDAEALRKAMKGFGTDEKTLIEILARRVNSQRQEIALQFKTLYGRDLIKDIKSETSGNFEDLLVALLTPLPQYYASELHNAMAGIGTKENVLFEILCTATNHEIRLINDAYQAMYRKRLEDDIRSDTSSHLKRLLVALSLGNRDESSHVDQAAAQADATQLLRAGELRFGTDESVFHKIFVVTNRSQLQMIFHKYQDLAGHSIEKAIDKEFSGDLEDALLAIAKSTKDRAGFFAEELYRSMKGSGTDDNSLIRLIVTHCETDLGEIKNKFQSKYSKSLRDWIASECSGDYKKSLLALIG